MRHPSTHWTPRRGHGGEAILCRGSVRPEHAGHARALRPLRQVLCVVEEAEPCLEVGLLRDRRVEAALVDLGVIHVQTAEVRPNRPQTVAEQDHHPIVDDLRHAARVHWPPCALDPGPLVIDVDRVAEPPPHDLPRRTLRNARARERALGEAAPGAVVADRRLAHADPVPGVK